MAGHKECRVYLVPGFFGFTALGALNYFHRVAGVLSHALQQRGYEAEVIECPTQPTGSIPRRAARLTTHVLSTGGLDAQELHFVGHSTGGLDARLLLSPQAHAGPEAAENQIAARTRSLITLSTPHHGAPLASFFTNLPGRHLLRWLARLATSRGGRLSLVAAARLAATAARLDDFVGRHSTVLDHLSDAMLQRVTIDRSDPVWLFLQEVAQDQGIIIQLTPESLNLFNALANDAPGVSYASICTATPPPPFHYSLDELGAPDRALLAGVFLGLHTLNRWSHGQYPYPEPDAETRTTWERDLPFEVTDQTNDGVVPTVSQVYGHLLGAVAGDHLDVVGQFYRPSEPLSDWLPSGAGFDDERFQLLWGGIADEIIRASEDGPES
jgi:hypothetical protein